MLDSAFNLTLDVLYPAPDSWPKGKLHTIENINYEDNKWELIFKEK